MLKKATIYFLLFNFINTVLFYNNEGDGLDTVKRTVKAQAGEINSLVEYVVEDCFNIEDATPEDEDDDWSDPFKTEKRDMCNAPIFHFIEQNDPYNWNDFSNFTQYESFFSNVYLDKSSPPPKQAA